MKFVVEQNLSTKENLGHLLDLEREEAATLVFALMAYEDGLNKSLRKARKKYRKSNMSLSGFDELLEEEQFLLPTLGKIARVKYAIMADHDTANHDRIRRWLDVV